MRSVLQIIAAAVTGLLMLAACNNAENPGETDSAETSASGDRAPVIVIGVDGAEWQVIEAMVDNGELPGFRQLMEEGAYGHLLN
ncbi:MAG: alkaline phosphatase family protein, partial [Wenzhouxiangellaceae bacterium]|nr:alkaline phosphatase family protein [Wenzhouxiangellaceae bacterium]